MLSRRNIMIKPTSFSTLLSTLSSLISPGSAMYKQSFASFLKTQQQHPRCAKLSLRDWLLTIIQRCPRYLLLLKDLIGCTTPDDPEYGELKSVHSLISKSKFFLLPSLVTESFGAYSHSLAKWIACDTYSDAFPPFTAM